MNERTDDSEYLDPYPNELTIAGVTVAECGTPDDAGFLVQILQEEGIRSAVLLPHKRMDLRGYQVRVAPDDEVRAKLILSTPIPVAKRQAYNSQLQVEPSPLPVCPKCGAADLILDGVDELNHWRCEACGITWDERLSAL